MICLVPLTVSSIFSQLPEMNQQLRMTEKDRTEKPLTVFIIQNTGLLLGFAIILCFVVFGGNIAV